MKGIAKKIVIKDTELFCVITCSWVGGHDVCVMCRTWELCLPRLRWTLQHSSQINTPLFTEAQRGSVVYEKAHAPIFRTLLSHLLNMTKPAFFLLNVLVWNLYYFFIIIICIMIMSNTVDLILNMVKQCKVVLFYMLCYIFD